MALPVAEARPRPARSRRVHDLARIVPVFGAVLLMPPLIGLFARPDIAPFGIPLIVVYLFGLWLALIVGALLITRRLKRTGDA